MVAIGALVFLPDAHRIAVRTAGIVEPRSVVEPVGLRGKRVVIHPAADGIAPPPWFIHLFGNLPAVGPDRAPLLVELVENHHIFGRLDDPARPEIVEPDPGKTPRLPSG